MSKKTVPVPQQLMELLERAFPDKAPRKRDLSIEEALRIVGQQEVMDVIRHHFNNQNVMEG